MKKIILYVLGSVFMLVGLIFAFIGEFALYRCSGPGIVFAIIGATITIIGAIDSNSNSKN